MSTPLFRPGEIVPESGIYRVMHDPAHMQTHEVTCVKGKPFPPCRDCRQPRFQLVKAAIHIADHPSFQ